MRLTGLVDVLAFLAFVALLFAVAVKRASTARQFLVADRSVGVFPLVATLVMTEFNTSTLLAFSAVGYTAGPMAIALPLVFLVGLAFYTATVARPWKRFDRVSVAELFSVRYSPALGRFAAIMLLTAMVGFSATYVKSLTLIFLPLAPGVSPTLLGAVFATIVVAVVLPGGLLSVIRSDVVSFVVTVIAIPLLLLIGAAHTAPLGGLAKAFPSEQLRFAPVDQWAHPLLPFWFVTTLIVLTCFTYIAAPWYGQKIFAAKSERTAFAAVAWSAVLVFLLYGATVLAASHYRVVRPELTDPQLVVPMMMIDWLPAGVRGLGYAVLFAAAVTTLGGVWTAMAAMIAVDFGWSRAATVGTQRLVLGMLAVLSWLGATFLVEDILARLILANIPVAALSFALLAGFHWPGATTRGAWASVVVGVVWGAGSYAVLGEAGGYTWTWTMYGIPVIFVTGILTSLFDPTRKRGRRNETS